MYKIPNLHSRNEDTSVPLTRDLFPSPNKGPEYWLDLGLGSEEERARSEGKGQSNKTKNLVTFSFLVVLLFIRF